MKQGFTIERHESFRVQLVTDDGFQYYFDQERMFVEFKHRMRVKAQSGGPPIAELMSRPRPFTELLPEVTGRVIEAAELVNGVKPRALNRIGVVSTTSVSGPEAPPGIRRLITYLGKPWANDLEYFDFNVAGVIAKTEEFTDRCIHSLARPEDTEQLMSIKFDWQRTFAITKFATADMLKKMAAAAGKSALAYFEDIGEGRRFDDEHINSNPA